jgi:hypothetical protein
VQSERVAESQELTEGRASRFDRHILGSAGVAQDSSGGLTPGQMLAIFKFTKDVVGSWGANWRTPPIRLECTWLMDHYGADPHKC